MVTTGVLTDTSTGRVNERPVTTSTSPVRVYRRLGATVSSFRGVLVPSTDLRVTLESQNTNDTPKRETDKPKPYGGDGE